MVVVSVQEKERRGEDGMVLVKEEEKERSHAHQKHCRQAIW